MKALEKAAANLSSGLDDGVHSYAFNSSSFAVQVADPVGNGKISNVMFDPSGKLVFATGISPEAVYVFLWNNGTFTPAPGSPYAVSGIPGRMAVLQ